MREYVFDLGDVASLDDWWDLYLAVVNGSEARYFGRNRDAYRDSLSGGPAGPEIPCRFVFVNLPSEQRVRAVTKRELQKKRQRIPPADVWVVDRQLELLELGIGETILHWILDPPIRSGGIEVIVA